METGIRLTLFKDVKNRRIVRPHLGKKESSCLVSIGILAQANRESKRRDVICVHAMSPSGHSSK
jgi:hypothetical protein